MTAILIVGMAMAIASAVFWCLEALPFIRAGRAIPPVPSTKNPLKVLPATAAYLGALLVALLTLWPLVVDLFATIWLTGAFGFSGLVGGVIGLTVSNVISIFLLVVSRKTTPRP